MVPNSSSIASFTALGILEGARQNASHISTSVQLDAHDCLRITVPQQAESGRQLRTVASCPATVPRLAGVASVENDSTRS